MPNPVKIVAGLLCIGSAIALRAMEVGSCIPAQAVEFGSAGIAAARTSDGADPRRPEVNLLQPGRYCLTDDLHASCWIAGTGGR